MNEFSAEHPEDSSPASYAESQAALSGSASRSVQVHKGLIIGAVVLVAVLLASVAGLAFALLVSRGEVLSARGAAEAALERANGLVPATPKETTPPSPDPGEEDISKGETYGLGDTFSVGAVTLTIHSVEAVDSVEVSQGEPLLPDAGGQLFMMKSTYSNSKNQADLSCSSGDLYLQMEDSEGREISQMFDSYRIPGNPGCNEKLLQDTPREWSLVFQGPAGSTPSGIIVTETITWPEPVMVQFR